MNSKKKVLLLHANNEMIQMFVLMELILTNTYVYRNICINKYNTMTARSSFMFKYN